MGSPWGERSHPSCTVDLSGWEAFALGSCTATATRLGWRQSEGATKITRVGWHVTSAGKSDPMVRDSAQSLSLGPVRRKGTSFSSPVRARWT